MMIQTLTIAYACISLSTARLRAGMISGTPTTNGKRVLLGDARIAPPFGGIDH